MPIYSYSKIQTSGPTGSVVQFNNTSDGDMQELASVDGLTYVHCPDNITPPAQPAEINWQLVTLTDTLREAIKTASPQCRLISDQMISKIRASYSINDEMYFARVGVGAANGMYQPSADELQQMTLFGEFVESIRQWGRDERAKLGL